MGYTRMRKLRNLIFAGSALFFLIAPTSWAGHETITSPVGFSATINAFDGVAIRGFNGRNSTGFGDVQAGIAGWSNGDAAGFQATVVGGLFRAGGNATQPQASVRGVETFAGGNATAEASNVTALTAGAFGNAEGLNSSVLGVNVASSGSATGPGARVVSVHAPTPGSATGSGASVVSLEASMTGSATGPGASIVALNSFSIGSATGNEAQVQVIRALASGNAVGPDSLVRGATINTTGNATGLASAVQSIRVRATGNAVGADSAVTGVAVTAEGAATGSGSIVNAVRARTTGTSGPAVAVFAATNSPQGIGVHGIANNPAGLAAKFDGRVQIDCPSRPCLTVQGHNVGDLAENMAAIGRIRPGDVVVLAQGRNSKWGVARATRPYDTRVAGIVSAQPRILLKVHGAHTVPVAMVGIVTAKTTASNGRIRVGDLLTTSSIPGRLMRCSTPSRCTGAIVAKALEPLRRGTGTILVLVWRQ